MLVKHNERGGIRSKGIHGPLIGQDAARIHGVSRAAREYLSHYVQARSPPTDDDVHSDTILKGRSEPITIVTCRPPGALKMEIGRRWHSDYQTQAFRAFATLVAPLVAGAGALVGGEARPKQLPSLFSILMLNATLLLYPNPFRTQALAEAEIQ